MAKIDLSEKLSKKNTIIAIILVAVFLVCGILAAVLGHKAYINSREAKIVNYSNSSSTRFFMRTDGLSLVYKYGDSDEQVNLGDVLKLSDGATLKILAVLDGTSEKVNQSDLIFDVKNGEHYFVMLNVISLGGIHTNGYVIELVKESEYSDVGTLLIVPEDILIYINAD